MSILVQMIDSAFTPKTSGVGSDYSSGGLPPVGPVAGQSGVIPPAPPTVPPAYANTAPPASPKKSSSFFKFVGLGILLVVLIGGLGVAYFLTQQKQEIRQQASQETGYTQQPFTFQDTNNNVELVFTADGNSGPTEVKGVFTYPSSPSCDANMSCNATAEFNITEITSDADYVCTTNTANLVYYKFLTNTNDPNYPGNLAHNDLGANIPANCNRPISQCGSDPQCTTSEVIRLYGPSGCGDECRKFVTSLDFNITNTEYGCGCVQFDPNIAELTLNCRRPDDTEMKMYKFTRGTASGPWAYAYNNAQCSTPTTPQSTPTPTPTTPANSTPTPSPTTPVTGTPTPTPPSKPTATPTPPPFGDMCLSISSSPAEPKYNDAVTFTCGLVQGVTKYEFRYTEPGSTQTRALNIKSVNVSQPLTVNKSGSYTVQCRICPTPTTDNPYCNDPNWGWDASLTSN